MAQTIVEPFVCKKLQMNENNNLTCALTADNYEFNYWNTINWKIVIYKVERLQKRVAKAIVNKQFDKAKALMFLLSKSFHAKLLAVFRVSKNKGALTAGIDKVIWTHPYQKYKATKSLKIREYKPKPLKRIYILKKNGKKRPSS